MATNSRVGNNKGYTSSLSAISTGGTITLSLRKPNVTLPLYEDRWYASRPYALGVGDDISIVLDNDVNSKRFDVSLARRVTTTGSTYSNTGVVINDHAGTMFGPLIPTVFPFEDFALLMQPRVKTNPATTSEILWHWKAFGANNVSINYDLQTLPSQPASWKVDYTRTTNPTLNITLPTGAPDSLTGLTAFTRIAVANTAEASPTTGHYFWLMTGYVIASLQSDGTDTTVTIAQPSGITLTGTGLTNGDVIYLTIDAGIPWIASHDYAVHSVSGLTFKVSAATGGAQGPTAGGTSTVRFDTNGSASFAGFTAGNTIVLSSGFGIPTIIADVPLQDTSLVSTSMHLKVQAKYGNAAAVTVPVMSAQITTLSRVQAFRSGGSVATIAFDINSNATSPAVAIALGSGGFVWVPTWYSASNALSYPFMDGINYVKTTNITPSGGGYGYTIDLKLPIDASLTGYAQWGSEEVYLCPMTAANVCAYLNNLAVCGLSANGKAETSSGGSKIQISTSTIGSVGSVQVRGGLANSALANVRGSAVEPASYLTCSVAVPTTQISGFHVGWPVKITNSTPYIKANAVSSRDLVSIVGNTWSVVWSVPFWLIGTTYALNAIVHSGPAIYQSLTNGNVGNNPTSSPGSWLLITYNDASVAYSHNEPNVYWQIERHGNYVAMVWANDGLAPNLANVQPGSYMVVSNDGVTDTVSIDNEGTFIVTAVDSAKNIVYFENSNAIEENSYATVNFIEMDSLMPGDQIVVGSDIWGPDNRRTFTVDTVNYISDGIAETFTTIETPASYAYPPTTAGLQSTVQVRSRWLHTFVKTISSIVPLSEDPTYSIIGLKKDVNDVSTFAIGENFGSQLSALDKFAFPVATTIGTDGYAHSVGLIGEADKVMYGYETDPVSYPGVVAAGSNINISGPLVKRIQIGLSLRVRGTASVIFEAVRGAVATFVNNSKVGESIAISDIISVASSIGGVEAVSVSSPAYTTSADRITVQPYEKALVLQPELDITLTLIG